MIRRRTVVAKHQTEAEAQGFGELPRVEVQSPPACRAQPRRRSMSASGSARSFQGSPAQGGPCTFPVSQTRSKAVPAAESRRTRSNGTASDAQCIPPSKAPEHPRPGSGRSLPCRYPFDLRSRRGLPARLRFPDIGQIETPGSAQRSGFCRKSRSQRRLDQSETPTPGIPTREGSSPS